MKSRANYRLGRQRAKGPSHPFRSATFYPMENDKWPPIRSISWSFRRCPRFDFADKKINYRDTTAMISKAVVGRCYRC